MVCGNIFTPREEVDIVDFVLNVMDCRKVPGLTLSVVKGGDTWTHGFGLADLITGRNVTSETLFATGSLGKAFTMTLLGNLIQETGYTWDTKLSDIKGVDLEFIDDQITREATLSDLLAHRTGLSSVTDYGFIGGYPAAVDKAVLAKRTKFIPKMSEFRNSFLYNNMMYMLVGYIAEVLGKDSWQNLMMSRIFEPIGMLDTKILVTPDDVKQDNTARPYIMPGDQLEDGNYNIYRITPLEPAGGILSNAVDMAKWMRFNLYNGSTDDGQQLLKFNFLEEAFQDQNMLPYEGVLRSMTTPAYPVNDTTKAYGYAWFTSTYRGYRRLWHSGGLFSYISLLWLYPDQDIGIFASVNGPGTVKTPGLALKTILTYVSDVLLEQTPWLNPETACSFPSPWVNSSKTSVNLPADNFTNDKLTDFEGTFGNELLPDIKISVKERDEDAKYLWLELNRIKGELILTADEDKFRFKMVDPWEYAIEREFMGLYITYPVEFERSENGDVESFDIQFSDKDVMKYIKGVRFMDAINVSKAPWLQCWVNLILFLVLLPSAFG